MKVNGVVYTLGVRDDETLLEVLRDRLGLTGVKKACDGAGECGSCTILLNGKAVDSCLFLAVNAEGADIVTIEGLATEKGLHPLQEAFLRTGALQCGFCSPGMILSAKALLDENPNASRQEITDALAGNLCRCTGYVKIIEAIQTAKKGRIIPVAGG